MIDADAEFKWFSSDDWKPPRSINRAISPLSHDEKNRGFLLIKSRRCFHDRSIVDYSHASVEQRESWIRSNLADSRAHNNVHLDTTRNSPHFPIIMGNVQASPSNSTNGPCQQHDNNHANQCNPNNARYNGYSKSYSGRGSKRDLNNHANQMNPNNAAYYKSRNQTPSRK